MDSDPLKTQRDVGSAVVSELSAAGFDVADEVGRGGFGIVFRCSQTALGRMVAVKVLTADVQRKRIALSIKEATAAPAGSTAPREPRVREAKPLPAPVENSWEKAGFRVKKR